MGDIIDVKKKLNSLVKKSKPTAEGFSYICQLDGYQCVGRKTIIEYLKEKHEETYNDLKAGFEDETEFRSQLSKLVMSVPYSNEEVNVNTAETKSKTTQKEPDNPEIVEEKPDNKNLPLTLDYMRTIDGRTTLHAAASQTTPSSTSIDTPSGTSLLYMSFHGLENS